MTNPIFTERNAEIIRMVRATGNRREVARIHEMSTERVNQICRGAGITEGQYERARSSFSILAILLAGKGHSEIAKELRVPRDRVYRVARMAREAGIVLPDSGMEEQASGQD